MTGLARIFHIASTVLLVVGFLGVATFVWDTNFVSHDGGGANIGLALITMLCLVAGALGVVAAGLSAVFGLLGSHRKRAQSIP